jgi:hypothetical protein
VPWAPRRSIAAEAQGKLEDSTDAAAATWSCWLTVVGGARMMSAMVAFWICFTCGLLPRDVPLALMPSTLAGL